MGELITGVDGSTMIVSMDEICRIIGINND